MKKQAARMAMSHDPTSRIPSPRTNAPDDSSPQPNPSSTVGGDQAEAAAGDGQDITPGPEKAGLTAGALEGSSVNAMNIMVKLIDQSRAFEQAINMIKEAKTTDEAGASKLKPS